MTDERQLAGMMAELRSRGDLPALDANVATICSLTEHPLTGAADLTSVILRDAALTASVVSTANSALYSPSEPVKTVSTAILLLGFEKVRALFRKELAPRHLRFLHALDVELILFVRPLLKILEQYYREDDERQKVRYFN